MWSQEAPQALYPLELDEATREDFRSILEHMGEKYEVIDYALKRYGSADIETELNKPAGMHKVTDLDPRKALRRFDARKANTISTFALLALTQAMTDAGRKIKRDGQTIGMIFGMSKGPQATVDRYLQSLFPDQPKYVPPNFLAR